MNAFRLPASVCLCEVGPRDGLQMEPLLPASIKVALIDALSQTGVAEIQVTSFVNPKAIPQLADADEVMQRIERRSGVRYTALVPNERGANRALRARVDAMDLFVSVSESHCLANIRMTTAEAMAKAREVAAIGRASGTDVTIGFPTALGCPFEGFPPYERLEGLVAEAVDDLGLERVNIADTAGMADPARVYRTMTRLRERFPHVTFGLHLHDTRGMGLANLLAGMLAGVTVFDASFAGLGGCPYAPGASGNIATEDAVHMLEGMGVLTGISLGALLEVSQSAARHVGHAESAILKAGTSADLVERNALANTAEGMR